MATINRLIESDAGSGLRVYLYPRMTHAKVVLSDSKIAAIGSANLTPRSMLTSREVTFFVHGLPDDPFIEKLRDRLMADIVDSKLILQGAEDGVEGVRDGIGWTLAIAQDTGKMVLTASGDAVAFTIFGACTTL